MVLAEPAVEGQQHRERHEPQQRPGHDDAAGVDLYRRWCHEVGHAAKRTAVNAAQLRCRPACVDLGVGPDAFRLARQVAGWPGLIVLQGAWADDTALLASHPLRRLDAVDDPLPCLDDQPAVAGVAPDTGALVGGGWFGRLAFDGASQLSFHDHVVRLVGGRWQFEALESDARAGALAARLEAWRAALAAARSVGDDPSAGARPTWRVGPFSVPPAADHLAAVERAVALIRAGDLYQVNVCTRLRAGFAGSPAALFEASVAALQPRYGALLTEPGGRAVVSLSPELFLRRRGRALVSEPIKGTLPRDGGPATAGNADALRRSAKDVAENVMIVDLMRNDLGRVAATGTVRVAGLLSVQPHPGVWHLVSGVAAQLRAEVGDTELLRATFPPGSVTGAPKVRAVAAIGELEATPRGSYTGAIGFASPLWGAEFSVAIRTFEIDGARIELGVGGGVTADSVPVLEWRECLDKAAPLVAAAGAPLAPALRRPAPVSGRFRGGLLETILGLDGRPVRLADHLARLDRSCRELYGAGLPGAVADRVRAAAGTHPSGRAVLRVVVAPDLAVRVSAATAGPPPGPTALSIAIRTAGPWRHKWADRSWTVGQDAALFVAADGHVHETTRGNVFLIEPDGTLVTPPLTDDVLPGVTRRALLDGAIDEGRPTALRAVPLAEFVHRPAFWTSSLSGAVPIHQVDGVELPRADAVVRGFTARLFGGAPAVR